MSDEYGMNLIKTYLKGSFPYAIWSNGNKNIKVVYDFTDDNPIHIFVYDSDDFAMYSYKELFDEFKLKSNPGKDIDAYIIFAANKFHDILKQDNALSSLLKNRINNL